MAITRLPATDRRRAERLLHQQCWNWGRDIVRPEGNLLLEAGFERQRPPERVIGSTHYKLVLQGGGSWMLWGFGFFYGNPQLGGIYVNRYRFKPHWMNLEDVEGPIWKPDMVPPAVSPPSTSVPWELVAEAALRIADYEDWAIERCGVEYRNDVFEQWRDSRKGIAPEQLPAAWRALALRINPASQPHREEVFQ